MDLRAHPALSDGNTNEKQPEGLENYKVPLMEPPAQQSYEEKSEKTSPNLAELKHPRGFPD